jgi:hypothetical protein
MKRTERIFGDLFIVICLCIFFECTKHPFGANTISPPNRQIRGEVVLSDRSSSEGVYVWLESFDIGSFTDGRGRFEISLPVPALQGLSGGADGAYNLYFFVANYKLSSAKVAVHNGAFLYSYGDFNGNGDMNWVMSMLKLLQIRTTVEPDSVASDFEGPIFVEVGLRAVFDSVTVLVPKIIGGYTGALLFHRIETGDVYIDLPDTGEGTQTVITIGSEEYIIRMLINIDRGDFPAGQYEVVPYIWIEQKELPEGLIASLSPNAEKLGADYLKIPFKREGGRFLIRRDG